MLSWMLCLLCAVLPGQGEPGQGELNEAIPGQGECTIVYFTSPHCEPCKQMLPALTQLKQEGWDIRSVNAPENTELAGQYRIDSLPTVVIVATQARKEVDRVVGVVSYDQLSSRFLRAAARFSPDPIAHNRPTNPNASSLVVRGQSPALNGGFPLLARSLSAGSNANAVAVATASPANFAREPRGSRGDTVPAQVAGRIREASGSPHRQAVTSAEPAKPLLSAAQAIERASQATVRIRVDEANATAYGTGTVVHVHGNQALVLTCGHLFRDMTPGSRLSVDLFAGTAQEQNVDAELIDFRAEDEDIGLISFNLPVRIEPVDILPVDEKLSVGQLAFSFGCDHGQAPSRRDTKISHLNRFLGAANVEIAGAPAVGRSGGGLFDIQGRLVGVCNAADAESDEGIYATGEVIYDQLKRIGLEQLFAPTGLSGANLQLASNSTSQTMDGSSFAKDGSVVSPEIYAPRGQSQDLSWPDERPDAAQIQSTAVAASTPQLPTSGELICIVRDAQGQSRVVTIASPSLELLRAIEHNQR